MKPTLTPTKKQDKAYELLQDDSTRFVLFGGGAGGGKSWLGCEWLITSCYIHPGSRWFIGRKELKRLMKSTFITFRKVCKYHNIPEDDWRIDGKYNYIEFENGSQIDLLDVARKPSDLEYERFGSSEYTGGWIEEAGEVDFGAYDVLKSRIGRHLNKELDLLPKMLLTANPNKGWLYREYYMPWKNAELPEGKAFIQSLYDDNPHTSEEYGKQLSQISNPATIQRLKYGNWEYGDDPAKLFDYEALVDLFSNTIEDDRRKYIVADIARYGNDKTVIGLWNGLTLKSAKIIKSSSTTTVSQEIRTLAHDEKVPFSHIIVDEDGVGGGVVDQLGGIKGFMANSTPFDVWDPRKDKKVRANFKNLKAQCFFRLSDIVNNHEMCVEVEDEIFKEELIEELEQIKQKNPDKDNKLSIIPKDEIKDTLGHSPDIADMMMMRMFFEFKRPKEVDNIRRSVQKQQARKRITKNEAR